ncbi:MAG: hypothetical protein ACI9SB_002968 [Candidatus Azotimanducaceae bacterium]|jgi:hypothetical protein
MQHIHDRDSFRLSDQIHVDYQRVSKTAINSTDAGSHFGLDGSFYLLRDIYELELESAELLRAITDQNRQLGSFLQNLNKRVDILCRSISGNKDENTAQVNPEALISEGGLSFISDELINPGEHLALMLVFHPSTLGLTCFCEVRHCRLTEDHLTGGQVNYRVGIKFINLDTTNQRLISRHIIRAQGDERRNRLREEHDVDRPT